MNKLLFILLCCIYTSSLGAQSVECEGRTLNVTDIVCTDGFMTFIVTAQSGGTNYIEGLPSGYTINGTSGDNWNPFMNSVTFWTESGNGMFDFNVPSLGCIPLNLSLYMEGQQQGCDLNLVIGNAVAPIPTLSQWMIAILAFMVAIFGVLGIRSSLSRKVEA
jgi:hypothetical protein